MNFADLQQTEVTLYGKGNNIVQMKFPVPPELKYNLRTKRVGIQDLEIDVSSFPRFVPTLSFWFGDVQQYKAGSANDMEAGNNGFNGEKDQLGYFFVIRKADNSQACTSWVTWSNPNNIPYNNNFTDRRTTYLTPYYYCYNFMDFLDMCQQALVAGFTTVLGSAPLAVPTFLYYPITKTFKLTLPQSLGADWNIEMSNSLKEMFVFQSANINLGIRQDTNATVPTYQILWTNVSVSEDDYNASCSVSNTIYPFDLYFLECSTLPINKVSFISTRTQVLSGADFQSKIVKRWRKHYNAIERQQILEVETEEQIDKLRSFDKNTIDDDLLSFVMWVRTRREQEYIEWAMPVNQQIKFLLNTYSLV